MPKDGARKKLVVEEVDSAPTQPEVVTPDATVSTPTVDIPPLEIKPEDKTATPAEKEVLEDVKEKVEELKDVTEDLSQSVEKSEDIQEEIAKAVGDVSVSSDESSNVISDSGNESVFSKPDDTALGPLPTIKSSSGVNPLVIIIPGLFLLGALLGGIYFYTKGIKLTPPKATPVPEASVTPTPTASASPSASIDLTKYPVNILNGSGIAGEAGKVKDILTGGGFKVSSTGNADSYDFTKTVIKTKSDVPAAFVTQLSTLLGKTYLMDTNASLSASSADEVEVIVGSTKAK